MHENWHPLHSYLLIKWDQVIECSPIHSYLSIRSVADSLDEWERMRPWFISDNCGAWSKFLPIIFKGGLLLEYCEHFAAVLIANDLLCSTT